MTFVDCNLNMQLVTKNKIQIYGYSFFIHKKTFLDLYMDNQLAKSFSTFMAMVNFKQHAQNMEPKCNVQFVDMPSNMTNGFVSL